MSDLFKNTHLAKRLSPIALAMSVAACGGSDSSGEANTKTQENSTPSQMEVTVTPHFAALYRQSITNTTTAASSSVNSIAKDSNADIKLYSTDALAQVSSGNDIQFDSTLNASPVDLVVSEDTRFDGQMQATSVTTGEVQTFDWPLTLKTDGSIVSHRTLALTPDTYDFIVAIEHDEQQYVAKALGEVIVEGTSPEVELLFQPHLGETLVILEDIDELATLNFQFSADELALLSVPKLGLIIDGADEVIYELDPEYGLTNVTLPLGDGNYDILVKLYDDNRLVGMMRAGEINIELTAGGNTPIDIIPLSADVDFSFAADNSLSEINIQVPEVLVDRVSGVENLAMIMRLSAESSVGSGDANVSSETLHSFVFEEGVYQLADAELPQFYAQGAQTATAYLSFYAKREDNTYTEAPLASCAFEVELGETQIKGCELSVDVSHQISGSLLSTLMLSVTTDSDPALAIGAEIYVDNILVGLTGSEYQTASIKLHLPAGEHSIRAQKGDLWASFTQEYAPLSVVNHLLYLQENIPTEIVLDEINILATGVKTFKLDWSDSNNWASEYQVCLYDVSLSANDFCHPLGEPVVDSENSVYLDAALLTDNPQFFIRATNGSRSVVSGMATPSRSQLDAAVGYFKASNTQSSDNFGTSVALSGDGMLMAVGASGEDSNATGINGDQVNGNASSTGAVYLYRREGLIWQQTAYVKPSTASGQKFGGALVLSNDGLTLVVGAAEEDSDSDGINGDETNTDAIKSGAVYVFRYTNATWQQQAYLKAGQSDQNDQFGRTLDISADGNTMVVGVMYEDSSATGVNGDESNNDAEESGAAYVFTFENDTWSQAAYLKASNSEADDRFGRNVAINLEGNKIAVSAPYEDSSALGINGDQTNNDAENSGAVYVFQRDGGVWSQQAYIKPNKQGGFATKFAMNGPGDTLVVSGNELHTYTFTDEQWEVHTSPSVSSFRDFQLSSDGASLFAHIGVVGDDTDIGRTNPDFAVGQYIQVNDVWTLHKTFKPTNSLSDVFGSSLAIDAAGHTLAVGDSGESSRSTGIQGDQKAGYMPGAGAVYVY
ncbi:FG-GAP repeat protein [uncultured Shewanella sp.]|uniref:FG-GAP repeat protein n=1 Tax=uncultured Shewanella sp. TaxID=173975 RepID=UPI0026305D0E|nr:FG-GAP repeat protein [uncultured Shewanella sp.]